MTRVHSGCDLQLRSCREIKDEGQKAKEDLELGFGPMSELGGDPGPVVLGDSWRYLPSRVYNYVKNHGGKE